MIDLIYGLFRKVPSNLDNARYKFHLRRSGLNLPHSYEGFYTLAMCTEVDLDYRNFPVSASKNLIHWLGHHQDDFASMVIQHEDPLCNIDVENVREFFKNDMSEIVDIMFQTGIWQKKLKAKISEQRNKKDTKSLVKAFNEAMQFYKDIVLPTSEKLLSITTDSLERKKSEYIAEYLGKLKNSTPTT